MIVTEEPTKSLAATDGAVSTRWCEAFWRNQPIVKTLVIPFPVAKRREGGERSTQVGFAEDVVRLRRAGHPVEQPSTIALEVIELRDFDAPRE